MSYTNPKIKSYGDCTLLWPTTRNKEAGKPLGAFRMFHEKETSSFRLDHYGYPMFRIYSNNVIEVLADRPSAVIERIVPLYEANIGIGRYRIDHHLNVPHNRYGWPDQVYMTKVAPELFKGIKFNLATGECLNRRPDLKNTEDPELRRAWKRDMQAFVKNIKARARLGALDQYVVGATGYVSTRDVFSDKNTKLIADAIRTQTVTEETLQAIAAMVRYKRYYSGIKSDEVYSLVTRSLQSFIDSRRIEIKRHYGVYKDPDQS